MLVTTDNPVPLLLPSQIRLIRVESGPGRVWDHDTGSWSGRSQKSGSLPDKPGRLANLAVPSSQAMAVNLQ